MTIFVIGKSTCAKCKAAVEKLRLLELEYTYFAQDEPNDWRSVKGLLEAFSAAAAANIDAKRTMPVIVIDNKAYLYAQAMKVLKGRK